MEVLHQFSLCKYAYAKNEWKISKHLKCASMWVFVNLHQLQFTKYACFEYIEPENKKNVFLLTKISG